MFYITGTNSFTKHSIAHKFFQKMSRRKHKTFEEYSRAGKFRFMKRCEDINVESDSEAVSENESSNYAESDSSDKVHSSNSSSDGMISHDTTIKILK